MFMRTFAHRQLTQRVRAQIQAVKMAHGHFYTIVPGIMAGGLVPVAIHGKDLIQGQLRNASEPVRQGLIGQAPQGVIHVRHHRAPALTVERGKIIRLGGTMIQSRPVFLEKSDSFV